MNEVARIEPTQAEILRVLENSLYPGAKPESIALVLSYCRVQGIDPMLRPVHIVPTNVKVGNNYVTRDVLMPGIADYRIKAARSGEYGGKSEPEFGPDVAGNLGGSKVTYPTWCRITVRRIVQGHAREFVATERWLENYATAGKDTDAPNRMWLKRPYGQLAKCAEAQALRMAFPEFSGGVVTAEEMEGKTGQEFSGPTIEARPAPEPPKKRTVGEWLTAFEQAAENAQSAEEANSVICSEESLQMKERLVRDARQRYDTVVHATLQKWFHDPPSDDVEIEGEKFAAA